MPNNAFGWQIVRVRDICESINYGFTASADFSISEPKLLRITDIQNGYVNWEQVPGCEISSQDESQLQLEDGDILIARTGGTVGKSYLVKEPQRAVFASYLIRLKPRKELIEPILFYYFLQSNEYWTQLKMGARGGAQPNVNAQKLGDIVLHLPPLDEQRRIAAVIDAHLQQVERARAAVEAQIAAAEGLLAAYLREIFESDEAQEWEVKSLDEICRDISDGTHFTPTYEPQGVPFLSVKDISGSSISFDDCRYISLEEHLKLTKRCKPERGDILYTKVGTTGVAKAIDIDTEFSIFVSVALLKLRPNILPTYVELALNSPLGKQQAADLTQGMANRNLVLKDIKRIQIPIPLPEIQEGVTSEFIALKYKLEEINSALQVQYNAVTLLPHAILRQAFAGEL